MVSYDESIHAITCINNAPERPHERFGAFMTTDRNPSGFDTSRNSFLGNLGSVAAPRAVVEGMMGNSRAVCEKMVAALEHSFELNNEESIEFNVAIGSTDNLETTRNIYSRIFVSTTVEHEFNKVQSVLKDKFSSVQVNTSEKRLNYLFNNWIKRAVQLHTEVGTDTGRGFRDVLQAAWAVSSYDPDNAREKIINSLQHQYSEGHALRGWNPVDTHRYSDGPVWIAPAVDSYLRETGDYAFLDIDVPYYEKGKGNIWEHVLASLRHATDDVGSHGLVRMHYGDWNDSLNMIGTGGKGESVFTSMGVIFAINCAVQIVRNVIRDIALEEELLQRKDRLTKAIEEHGWDGGWYLEGL